MQIKRGSPLPEPHLIQIGIVQRADGGTIPGEDDLTHSRAIRQELIQIAADKILDPILTSVDGNLLQELVETFFHLRAVATDGKFPNQPGQLGEGSVDDGYGLPQRTV